MPATQTPAAPANSHDRVLAQMLTRLTETYDGWRYVGMSHADAMQETLKCSRAGKRTVAEFKRTMSARS